MQKCSLRRWSQAYRSKLRSSPSNRSYGASAKVSQALRPQFRFGTEDDKKHEDDTLKRVFDSRPFWQDFEHSSSSQNQASLGLFQNRYLIEPSGFLRFAQDIRQKCQNTVHVIQQASSVEEMQAIPQQMDSLSDCLCRVLDLADFVRATHPNRQFQKCATEAYVHLWEYMNVLNTTPGLKSQLQKALKSPEVSSAWSEEEVRVAKNLLIDFSNSAIDLPEQYRQRFVELSNETKRLGSEFLDSMSPMTPYMKLKNSDIHGMSPTLLKPFTSKFGGVSLPMGGQMPYTALATLRDGNIRQRVYQAMKTVPRAQLQTLEHFLKVRCDIARLSNFPSYAAMSLSDKMAKSPEAVDSFLKALSRDNSPHVQSELSKLADIKQSEGITQPMEPWDVLFYQQQLNASFQSYTDPSHQLSSFFSVGTVMQGLSRLFDRLYGVRLVPRPTHPGETWTPDVRRLDVVHETDGHVAVLYCDLFQRAGKSPNPAHFTLRCSRKISDSELADESLASNDGMARSVSPSNGQVHQLPTITLICDFSHSSHGPTPSLLTFRDVQTLFHEMGHAIHSILGRTALQVVSGTRCATDFAELPSVLMENFAADEAVLGLFARHWETDEPLPYSMVQQVLERQKRGQGLHTESQILYSLLDQAYHSSVPSVAGFDSTQTFHDVYDNFASLREPEGISPQGFFGHLVEYGGTYYSYLFDRAIAGKIWRQIFRSGANEGGLDRKAGEKFGNEVLRWGGARDPWKCLGQLLEDERLVDGGPVAMEEVGRWGVHV